ncbi:MAG: PEP-CTERM sorting domain-containing protein, partial [Isosphaeraceae bacterium]
MQRMRRNPLKHHLILVLLVLWGIWPPARGDLIRPKTLRSYPDIAGDIVGSQTYTFDPSSKTGTFQVRNSPQFIALGPDGGQMVSVTPNQDGTLSQTLQLTLDQNGRLVPGTNNHFQLYGTVVIG